MTLPLPPWELPYLVGLQNSNIRCNSSVKRNKFLLVQVPVLNEISSIAKPPLVALPSRTILKSVEVSTDTWAGRHVGRVVSIVFASITHS
jgi:hypothetical protein